MESAFVKTWAHVINLSEAKTYPDTSIPTKQCFFHSTGMRIMDTVKSL